MATFAEEDHTAGDGQDGRPAEEDPARGPERRLVDALLDVSEEDFLRDLEPHEYHCYSGWEEAVRGWARAAPLSCILVTEKRCKKPKHKEADSPAPPSVGPPTPDPHSSASSAERRCDVHTNPPNGCRKAAPAAPWSKGGVMRLQKDAPEWPLFDTVHKTMSDILEERALRETALQKRAFKSEKHGHKPSYAVVPIKNFSFLPPIESQHPTPQRANGKKALEEESVEGNGFTCDKKSGMRATRAEPGRPACSGYHTCQHSPHLFCSLSVSIDKRYGVVMSSKCDQNASLAAGKRAHRPACIPTRVCALRLCEGGEIKV